MNNPLAINMELCYNGSITKQKGNHMYIVERDTKTSPAECLGMTNLWKVNGIYAIPGNNEAEAIEYYKAAVE